MNDCRNVWRRLKSTRLILKKLRISKVSCKESSRSESLIKNLKLNDHARGLIDPLSIPGPDDDVTHACLFKLKYRAFSLTLNWSRCFHSRWCPRGGDGQKSASESSKMSENKCLVPREISTPPLGHLSVNMFIRRLLSK